MISTVDIVIYLNATLGPTLTSHIWGADIDSDPEEQDRRVRGAYEAVKLISDVDGDSVARSWMIGMNPVLNLEAPATALRKGLYEDVRAAVAAYVNHG